MVLSVVVGIITGCYPQPKNLHPLSNVHAWISDVRAVLYWLSGQRRGRTAQEGAANAAGFSANRCFVGPALEGPEVGGGLLTDPHTLLGDPVNCLGCC